MFKAIATELFMGCVASVAACAIGGMIGVIVWAIVC